MKFCPVALVLSSWGNPLSFSFGFHCSLFNRETTEVTTFLSLSRDAFFYPRARNVCFWTPDPAKGFFAAFAWLLVLLRSFFFVWRWKFQRSNSLCGRCCVREWTLWTTFWGIPPLWWGCCHISASSVRVQQRAWIISSGPISLLDLFGIPFFSLFDVCWATCRVCSSMVVKALWPPPSRDRG